MPPWLSELLQIYTGAFGLHALHETARVEKIARSRRYEVTLDEGSLRDVVRRSSILPMSGCTVRRFLPAVRRPHTYMTSKCPDMTSSTVSRGIYDVDMIAAAHLIITDFGSKIWSQSQIWRIIYIVWGLA